MFHGVGVMAVIETSLPLGMSEDFSEAHLHCFFYVVVRGAVQGSRGCGMVFGPLVICFLAVHVHGRLEV